MKLQLILIILFILSLFGCAFFFTQWKAERKDRIRNQTNVEILANEFKQFKDSSAVQTRVLLMSVAEVKNSLPGVVSKLESMNIKLKNVDQVTTSDIVVNNPVVKMQIRDSVNYMIDTIPLQYLSYKDKFRELEIQKINNEAYITKDITRVPLFQVGHWAKEGNWKLKNILPWNWRKKELVTDITCDNPNAKIEASRTIKIVK